jgi:site-specific DNA recombinase
MTLRAAIYARFASERQYCDSLPNQITECQHYIESQGWLSAGTYEDAAVSGVSAAATRPAYQRLLRDAKAGAFDVVVVESVSRLSRNVADAILCYDQLTPHRIKLHTVFHGEVESRAA